MTVIPSRGIYSVTSYIVVVKGMKYPEAADAYAEQLLSDDGMPGLPEALRIGTTTDIRLPEKVRKNLVFNSPEHNALRKKVDWQEVMANRSTWIERLNKEIRT